MNETPHPAMPDWDSDQKLKDACMSFERGHLDSGALAYLFQHYPGLTDDTRQKASDWLQNHAKYTNESGSGMLTEALQHPAERPLISVIIPTYNRQAMLAECLASVLDQTWSRIEILIIDDCSNDGSGDWINERYGSDNRIRYFRNEKNMNAGYNRHRGYQESQGDFIVFLDDDDFYIDRHAFAKAMAKHQEREGLAFTAANACILYQQRQTIQIKNINSSGLMDGRDYLTGFQIHYDKPFSSFTAVFRKDVLEQAGFAGMMMMNDTSIYLRALMVAEHVYLFEDLVGVYRVHGENITNSMSIPFILDNLNEKVWVYDHSGQANREPLSQDWLYRQIMITVRSYLVNNPVDSRKIRQLMKGIAPVKRGIGFKIQTTTLLSWLKTSLAKSLKR